MRHRILIFTAFAVLFAAVTACSSPEKIESTSSTPVVRGDVGTLVPPATQEPPSQFNQAVWGLLYCPQREFPAALEPFASPLEDQLMLESWESFLADATVVDSNSRIKSFELIRDGSGVWTDSSLRPVLHGRDFKWNIVGAPGDRWSDVDLILSFDAHDYELELPLRRRDREIVEPAGVEGITVTERTCENIEEFEAPRTLPPFPEQIWRPSPGVETTPLPETISTTARPKRMVWANGHMFADNGAGFWVKIDSEGTVVADFRAARAEVDDFLFDGKNLWFTDRGEGELRKYDLDGNRLDTSQFSSPSSITFDGTNIWLVVGDGRTTLVNMNTDGERLFEVELPSRIGSIDSAGGLLWVGLDEEWSIASYGLDGTQRSKTYLQGTAGGIGFDGTHVWVTVPDNERVHKLTIAGEQVDMISLPPRVDPDQVIYDGDQLWFISACCTQPEGYETEIVRATTGAELTGIFQISHAANDAAFDGQNIWFSHDDERAFTKLPIDSDGPFWKPIIGPYTEISIEIPAGDRMIGGTLTVPIGPGPHPVVIIPPNRLSSQRDVLSIGVRRNHDLADDLARHGFAAFRYDGRGFLVPGRLSSSLDATHVEEGADLHAIIDAMKERQELDPEQVSIWGFGQTNLVASTVIPERDDIRNFVGSLLPLGQFLVEHTGPQILLLRFTVESEEEIEEYARFYNEAIDIAVNGGDWKAFEQSIIDLENASGRVTTPLILSQPFQGLMYLESPRFAAAVDFDATPYMESITDTPYLLMYQGLDLTIPASIYAPRAEEMIARSGNPDAMAVVFDKANFIWMPAITGQFDEIHLLENIYYPSYIKPGLLETGTSWLMERTEFPAD